MPLTEETLSSYLSVVEVFTLKTLSLPTKPLQVTSQLNGRVYAGYVASLPG